LYEKFLTRYITLWMKKKFCCKKKKRKASDDRIYSFIKNRWWAVEYKVVISDMVLITAESPFLCESYTLETSGSLHDVMYRIYEYCVNSDDISLSSMNIVWILTIYPSVLWILCEFSTYKNHFFSFLLCCFLASLRNFFTLTATCLRMYTTIFTFNNTLFLYNLNKTLI